MAEKKVYAENIDNYVVKAESEGFNYTMDYTERNNDGASAGTSPTGMLLTALAGCHLMTARSYLTRTENDFVTLKVEITGIFEHGKDNWHLKADVTLITDAALDAKGITRLDRFIHRHCTVSSVLSQGNNQINLKIEAR